MKNNIIDLHYHNAVNTYSTSSLFFLQPSYEQWLMIYLEKLFAFQKYSSSIRIVDLGCGNGFFLNKFISNIKPMYNIESSIAIDPYSEWLDVASEQPNITNIMCLNANKFSKISPDEINYSHLLMKEMVHHIDSSMLYNVFQGIYKQINDNGTVVVITRPVETNYPFFDIIHHFWRNTQMPYENVVNAMKEVGLDVKVEIVTLPIVVQIDEWLSFIKNKTWSVFSMCTEKEMIDGLHLLKHELPEYVSFNEVLIFIVGHKLIKN